MIVCYLVSLSVEVRPAAISNSPLCVLRGLGVYIGKLNPAFINKKEHFVHLASLILQELKSGTTGSFTVCDNHSQCKVLFSLMKPLLSENTNNLLRRVSLLYYHKAEGLCVQQVNAASSTNITIEENDTCDNGNCTQQRWWQLWLQNAWKTDILKLHDKNVFY